MSPHTVAGPWPPALAGIQSRAGQALREARGRLGISGDALSPKPRKPRDGRSQGAPLGSTLCLQVSAQPSAGKMTSLPSPVGRVRPVHTLSPRVGTETGPPGGCSLGLPPASGKPLAPHLDPTAPRVWGLPSPQEVPQPGSCLSLRLSVGRQPDPHPTVQPGAPGPQQPCSEGCGVRCQNTGFSRAAPHT